VLVTNDDGIDSEGLRTLAGVAVASGLIVTVAAPSWDSSGAGTSLAAVSNSGRVLTEHYELDPGGVARFGVQASPAFIVRAALHGAFGPPPDLVLSGINLGSNVGRGVLHSATVGAALTAASYGRRALAISAEVGGAEGWKWDTAAEVARRAIAWLLCAPPSSVLNVNVPNRTVEQLRGLVATTVAPAGTVQANITDIDVGFIPVTFTDNESQLQSGTDAAALAQGYASITALKPLWVDQDVDLSGLVDAETAGSA
jgi:5'-nucleotidase